MAILAKRTLLKSSYLWSLVFALTLLVYAVGLFIPIMEPDAAVYAQVAMEMHDRGDYLSIYHKGADWLDKPHFPFWMSALSYEVFGVDTFAYKLPAVIFVLLGAFYTYLFGKKFYSAVHGWLAAIILLTAEHIIISNQDVRAEPFMTGLMIMGLYHLTSLCRFPAQSGTLSGVPGGSLAEVTAVSGASTRRQAVDALLGSLACACLIMTKGLFTIIPIASGIGLALVYERRWKDIVNARWLVVIVLTAVFMSPAIYGYYQQFDQHPEKVVFGQNNVSGVEFFLWTSQWGRFTNTGPIKGKGDITFFIHTTLWAFLPWAFAAFFALFSKARQLVKRITIGENYTFFGFMTLFVIFSASRFQLSFYLNPIFPQLAIMTSAVLLQQTRRVKRTFSIIHVVLSILLVVGLIGLHYLFAPGTPSADTFVILFVAFLIAFYVFTRRGIYMKKAVFATALIVVGVNYYLNREFYPALLKYQGESEAAYYMRQNDIGGDQVVFADEIQSVADVILQAATKVIAADSIAAQPLSAPYVFTTAEGRAKLDSSNVTYNLVKTFEDFPVTRLTGKFVNRRTRSSETKEKFLLKVEGRR